MQQYFDFYKTAVYTTACEYLYSNGRLSLVSIRGYGPGIDPNTGEYLFRGSGQASLRCEAGETRTATGCAKVAEIPRQRRVKIPNDRSCGANANVAGNPVEVSSGRKLDSRVDFMSDGPLPLTFQRFYRGPSLISVKGAAVTKIGQNWASNFDAVAFWGYFNSGMFHFKLPDGRDFNFDINSSGVATPQYFSASTLIWTSGSHGNDASVTKFADRVELTVDGETTYVFNTSMRLTAIRYRGGYEQTLTYGPDGRRTLVMDNLGRSFGFSYDAFGYLAELSVPGSQVYKYRYKTTVDVAALEATYPTIDFSRVRNQANVLEKVILPDATPGTDADNPTITYHYEDASDPRLLTGVTDERGIRFATWAYDANKRAVQSTHAGGADNTALSFNDASSTVTVTNPLGKQAIHNFALVNGSARRLSSIAGQPTANCPSSTQSFTYDTNSFVASVTDEEGRVTAYVNDARGRATSITRGSGSAAPVVTTASWHSLYNVPTQVVEPGVTTDYVWSASGTLTSRTQTDTTTHSVPYATSGQSRVWTYTYGTAGLLTSIDGPLAGTGDTVAYTYDTAGYLQTVTNELGHVTTVDSVNGRGQPTLVTDPNGVKTALAYDSQGRLLTMTVDSIGTPATTTMTYDAIGQITKITQPDGSWQSFTYDDARRLTAVTTNTGETTNYVRDAMGGATSITRKKADSSTTFARTQTFDELGRLLRAIGANSSTWGFGYDRTDNLVAVTDPRSNLYNYGFDALNRLISETDEENQKAEVTRNGVDAIASYKDGRNITTSYVRNGFGEVIQAASPDSGTVIYHRDTRGLITQKTDGRGVVTNQTFDTAGRILTRTFPSASGLAVTWSYDSVAGGNTGKGRLTGMSDASGTTAWIYDARGNVLSETRVIAGQAYVVSYAYDLADKVTRITYPSGRIVDVSRDATGRVGGVTTKQNAAAASATLASGVVYQPFGDLQSLTYGNGLSLWRTFTADDQLNQLLVENSSTGVATIKRFHDRTDNGLNLTSIATYDDVSPPPSQSFWYSPARRLQNATGVWGELTYYYGSGGNRTHEILVSGGTTTEKVTSYASTSNRLTQVTTNGTVSRTFAHDDAGNVVTDTRSGTAWSFTHDAAGRLSQASAGGQVKGTYTYDGLERLSVRAVTNTTPSGTTHLIYDTAGHLLAEANAANGATIREYVWLEVDDLGADSGPTARPANDNQRGGAGGKLGAAENDKDPTARAQLPSLNGPKRGIAARAVPLAVVADVDTASPQTLFVHADYLDRPVRMTDAAQALVWDAVYKPYGEVHSLSGSASLDARFPGQWFQLETGLHYNWHRHYDPTTGRYLQPDPLGFVDGPSVYAYAVNAPMMWIDREGLASSNLPKFNPGGGTLGFVDKA